MKPYDLKVEGIVMESKRGVHSLVIRISGFPTAREAQRCNGLARIGLEAAFEELGAVTHADPKEEHE